KLAGAAKHNWVFSLTEGMRCPLSRLRLGPEPFPEFVLIRGRRMWKLNQHASAMRQCRRDWPAQLLPWFIARLALHEHSSVKKDGKYSPNQSRMVGVQGPVPHRDVLPHHLLFIGADLLAGRLLHK